MSIYRSHLCSDLSTNDLDKEVTLSGWIDIKRDHGNLLFIDLRDNYGITQCVIDAKNSEQTYEKDGQTYKGEEYVGRTYRSNGIFRFFNTIER